MSAAITSTSLRLADIDGDGRLDAVYGAPIGPGVSLGRGDGAFETTRVFGTPSFESVTVGDLNGDFKPDRVVSCSPSVLLLQP